MEIHMFRFGNRVFQIIVIIWKTGIRLYLTNAVGLQNGTDRDSVIDQSLILINFALPDRCAFPVNPHGLGKYFMIFSGQFSGCIACTDIIFDLIRYQAENVIYIRRQFNIWFFSEIFENCNSGLVIRWLNIRNHIPAESGSESFINTV